LGIKIKSKMKNKYYDKIKYVDVISL